MEQFVKIQRSKSFISLYNDQSLLLPGDVIDNKIKDAYDNFVSTPREEEKKNNEHEVESMISNMLKSR